MGQYHQLVNFDKKELVHPHKIGLGLKQCEHTLTVASLSDVLYMLMTTSPARGGGDLQVDFELEEKFKTFGRWLGDRVAVFGDYTEIEDVPFLKAESELTLNERIETYQDITNDITPSFELAFAVKIDKGVCWVDRDLDMSVWGWLVK